MESCIHGVVIRVVEYLSDLTRTYTHSLRVYTTVLGRSVGSASKGEPVIYNQDCALLLLFCPHIAHGYVLEPILMAAFSPCFLPSIFAVYFIASALRIERYRVCRVNARHGSVHEFCTSQHHENDRITPQQVVII